MDSFTIDVTKYEKAISEDPKTKGILTFLPNYDKESKKIDIANSKTSTANKETFNADINRMDHFYLEDKRTNIIIDLKTEGVKDFDSALQNLTAKKGFSEAQASYILQASHQGTIGGAATGIIPWMNSAPSNRNNTTTKIVIDKNNKISLIGGRKIGFYNPATVLDDLTDPLKLDLESKIAQNFLTFTRTMFDESFKGPEMVTNYIELKLGKLGDVKITPDIQIGITGEGAIYEAMKKDLGPYTSGSKPDIEKQYSEFSKFVADPKDVIAKKLLNEITQTKDPTTESVKKIIKDKFTELKDFHKIFQEIPKVDSPELQNFQEPKFLKEFGKKSEKDLDKFADKLSKEYIAATKQEPAKEKEKKNIFQRMVRSIKRLFKGPDLLSKAIKLEATKIGAEMHKAAQLSQPKAAADNSKLRKSQLSK